MKKAWKTISRSTRTAKFGLVVMVLWIVVAVLAPVIACLLYTSPSPRDRTRSRMPSSA